MLSTPSALATGIVATSGPSITLPPTMSSRRLPRSASAPATSPNTKYGTTRKAKTIPVWAAEPVASKTSTGSTTVVIAEPTHETPSATAQRMNAGS